MRKYIAFLMIFTVIAGGITVYLMAQSKLEVVLNNDTDQEITGLTITYEGIKEDVTVPPIAAEDTEVVSINPKKQSEEDFSEGTLLLTYTDEAGTIHTETVIGYFEKGYRADAEVTIQSIEEEGKLNMEIEDITNLY